MAARFKHFMMLKSSEQVDYLKSEEFTQMNREAKIDYLKKILYPDLPSGTTLCALELLKQLNYPDSYFFRKYLFHIDRSIADTARCAIDDCNRYISKKNNFLISVLKEGRSDDRILLVDYFLSDKGQLNEKVLISFLSIDDRRMRELIIKKLNPEHHVDESFLSGTITRGAAWYLRAALVEILGNRRSKHLFDCIEFLINDKNVEVRLKLIDALAKFKMEECKTYLKKLTTDSLVWVRKEATRALATI